MADKGGPLDPSNPPQVTPSQLGQLDQALYGDLLAGFGGPGKMSNDYLTKITNSSPDELRRAHHDARNDSGVRPIKPYSNE